MSTTLFTPNLAEPRVMLLRFTQVQGQALQTRTGPFGRVRDFCVNYPGWELRNVTVDIGSWFVFRSVMVPACALREFDSQSKTMGVNLTTIEIMLLPTLPPAFRKHCGSELQSDRENSPAGAVLETSQLYSSEILQRNYTVQVSDGEIGSVDNFVLEYQGKWRLRYVIIQTSWGLAKMVLLPCEYIATISANQYAFVVTLPGRALHEAPEYRAGLSIDGDYAAGVLEYYSRVAGGFDRSGIDSDRSGQYR